MTGAPGTAPWWRALEFNEASTSLLPMSSVAAAARGCAASSSATPRAAAADTCTAGAARLEAALCLGAVIFANDSQEMLPQHCCLPRWIVTWIVT